MYFFIVLWQINYAIIIICLGFLTQDGHSMSGCKTSLLLPQCFAFHIILIVTLVKKSQQQLSYCMKGVQNLPNMCAKLTHLE